MGTSRGGLRPLDAAAPATTHSPLRLARRQPQPTHPRGAGEYDGVGLCERPSSRRDVAAAPPHRTFEAPVTITSAERPSFAPIAQRAAHDPPPANTTRAMSARR